jgi:excisionase family DNA binding protein
MSHNTIIPKRTYVSVKEAARLTGLHPHTLRKYADSKEIGCYKTPSGGHRRFARSDLEKMCTPLHLDDSVEPPKKVSFLYSRVSSKKQLDDLSRQTDFIRSYRPEYSSYDAITDIASGINFKRRGLQTILDACLQRAIGEVVVAHRDRLCRFGFELIESIVSSAGGRITVLDSTSNKSTEQELADDLLSIVHIYSCRPMGRRSYSRRKKCVKDNSTPIETNIRSEINN